MNKRSKQVDPEQGVGITGAEAADAQVISENTFYAGEDDVLDDNQEQPPLTEEEVSDFIEDHYVRIATSIQDFAENTRQAVIAFEFSRQDLTRVSMAVDMMANAIVLLRNYINFYIEDVDPQKYQELYIELNAPEGTDEDYPTDEEELEEGLRDL